MEQVKIGYKDGEFYAHISTAGVIVYREALIDLMLFFKGYMLDQPFTIEFFGDFSNAPRNV